MKLPRFILFMLSSICGLAFLMAQEVGEEKAAPRGKEDDAEVNLPSAAATVMIGTYTGKFQEKKMTLSLDKIVGQTIMGYSIVDGNERAFSGTWEKAGEDLLIAAKEPGDHPLDGFFQLAFNPAKKLLAGIWIPNDKGLATAKLELARKAFKYNPKLGQYPESSTRLLKERDVENLRPEELRIMRNEIYARHGYCFRLADMREHFNDTDWYMPVAVDITTQLTAIEKKNEALIKRYENYGEQYYDKFGR